jgi:hypothetical protein
MCILTRIFQCLYSLFMQLLEAVNLVCVCVHNNSSRCVSVYIFRNNRFSEAFVNEV